MDDPLFVEEEEDDYWYRGYNMRTGERGIFPAFYAHEVMGQSKELTGELGEAVRRDARASTWCCSSRLHLCRTAGLKRNPAWMETFSVQFLGSVEVPHHQGNGILCAAMQKVRARNSLGFNRGLVSSAKSARSL